MQMEDRGGIRMPLRMQRDWLADVVDQAALLMARQKYTYVVSR